MQPSAGQVTPERSYGRWRATVLSNRDLLAGLLPTFALFVFSYGLECSQSDARTRECSIPQYSMQMPDSGGAAVQCRPVPDPADAVSQGPLMGLAARMLGNATERLCRSGQDEEEDLYTASAGTMLAKAARFMLLQVCTPLLRRHYESICGLLSLYATVMLLLLRKRLYVVWRPVLLAVVRLLPLSAAAYVACSKAYPDLLLRLDECFMFYVQRPGATRQMAARVTHLNAWQLQQLLLAMGVCWQAVTLPLPPHMEGPVAGTQGLLLLLIVGRISQALGMFCVPSFVAYWAACLLLCYVVPSWFAQQLDRRLRLRYRAWQSSVPSRGPSSEFEESEVQRHSSDTSTTSWWSTNSKEDTHPWHLPGHEGEAGSSSRRTRLHRRSHSSGSSSSSRGGERSPSPAQPPSPLSRLTGRTALAQAGLHTWGSAASDADHTPTPNTLVVASSPAAGASSELAPAAATTRPWGMTAPTAAAAARGVSLPAEVEEEPLPDWTAPQSHRSNSLDSAHDMHLSSPGVGVHEEHTPHQELDVGRGGEPRGANRGTQQQPSSGGVSLGLLPCVSSAGAALAEDTPGAALPAAAGAGQGLPTAAQPTQVSGSATAPSITTVYMQLPGAAPQPTPSPFTGLPSAAFRAALAIPPSTAHGEDDIGPATPSAGPAVCLRQASRSSQASTGSSGATTGSTAAAGGPASSSGGSFSGARPGFAALQQPPAGLEAAAGLEGAAGAAPAPGRRHRSALYTSRTQHMLLSAKVRFAAPAEGGELLQNALPSVGAASSSSLGSMGSSSSSAAYPAHAQQVAAAAVAAVQDMFGAGAPLSPQPEHGLLPVDSGAGSIESAGAPSCGGGSTSSYLAGSGGDRLAPVSSYGQASSCDSIQIQTPPPYAPGLAGLRAPSMALAGGGGLVRTGSDGLVLLRVECVTFPGCVQLMMWGWCGRQQLPWDDTRGRTGQHELATHLEDKAAAAAGAMTITSAAAVLVDAGCSRQMSSELTLSAAATPCTAAAVGPAGGANMMVGVSDASAPSSGGSGWARVKGALLALPDVVDVAGRCSEPHTWCQGGSDASSLLGLDAPTVDDRSWHRLPQHLAVTSHSRSPSSSSHSSSDSGDGFRGGQVWPSATGLAGVAVMARLQEAPAAGGGHQDAGASSSATGSGGGAGGSSRGASALHIMVDRPTGSSSGGSDTPSGAPGDDGGDTPRWRVGRMSGRPGGMQGSSSWLFQLQRHSPLVLLAHPEAQTVQLHLLLRPAPAAPASNPYLSTTPQGAVTGGSMVVVSSITNSSTAAEVGAALLPDVPQLAGRVGDVIVLLVKEGQVSSTWVWPEEQVLAALRHQLRDDPSISGDAGQDAVPGHGSDQLSTPPPPPPAAAAAVEAATLHARTGALTPDGYQFALELQLPLLEAAGVYHLVMAHQLPPSPEAPMNGLSSPCGSTLGQAPSVAFARLPLAVLPPGPYQEVYQLLLPAMWDEAASEWHARRQQQEEEEAATSAAAAATSAAAAAASSSMSAATAAGVGANPAAPVVAATLEEHVQTVLWQHWCQLADDLGQVLQLGATLLPRWRLQPAAHLNDAELHLLQQLAPVVLSFFLGHAMDGFFFFALSVLPPPLQQSWMLLHQRRSHAALLQQQQEERLTLAQGPEHGPSGAADAAGSSDQTTAAADEALAAARPSLSLPLLDLQGPRGASSNYLGAGSIGGTPCGEVNPAAAFYDDSSMALTRMNTAAVAACEARSSLESSTHLPVTMACPGPLLSAPAQLQGAAERALLDACPDAAVHGAFAAAGARLSLLLGLPHISGSFRPHGSPSTGLAMQNSGASIAGVTTPAAADPQRRPLWTQESIRSLLSLRSNSSGIFRSGDGAAGPPRDSSSRPSSSRWDDATAAAAVAAPGTSGGHGGQPWLEMGEEQEQEEEQEAVAAQAACLAQIEEEAAAARDASSPVLTWATPFSGFQAPGLEGLYKRHKHVTNLSSDWGCAGFIVVFMTALCVRLVWETDRWNTCGYILYLALKLVGYVPLLAGRTEFFISHREALVLALSQGLCCLLIANKALAEGVLGVPPLFMPPEGPLKVFWRVHGELLIYGLMMPFQVHLRMKWNVAYVLTEAGVLGYMFAHLFPVARVVTRFGGAAALSLGLAWWWDMQLRRKFLAGRLAKAAGGCAPSVGSSCSGSAGVGHLLAGKQKAE